jgi:hypothetical protein
MQPTTIAFSQGAFLVEVEPDLRDPRGESYVAHLSLLENDGTLLRPLVFDDGGRVVIHGSTEPLVLNSAITYLGNRFGALSGPEQPWHPHGMEWGEPYVVERSY